MSIQKQIKKELKKEMQRIERYELEHRSTFARAGALLLTGATIFSLTGLGHGDEKQRALRGANRDVVAQVVPVFNPANPANPAEKNETVRMPIKFDEGFGALANVGE